MLLNIIDPTAGGAHSSQAMALPLCVRILLPIFFGLRNVLLPCAAIFFLLLPCARSGCQQLAPVVVAPVLF